MFLIQGLFELIQPNRKKIIQELFTSVRSSWLTYGGLTGIFSFEPLAFSRLERVVIARRPSPPSSSTVVRELLLLRVSWLLSGESAGRDLMGKVLALHTRRATLRCARPKLNKILSLSSRLPRLSRSKSGRNFALSSRPCRLSRTWRGLGAVVNARQSAVQLQECALDRYVLSSIF